jgi:hypothetical protein
MKNLISLLTYVLELSKKNELIQTRCFKTELYAKFLNQSLFDKYEINKAMAHPFNRFVPCDLEGNFLEKPIDYDLWLKQYEKSGITIGFDKNLEYKIASSRCLFENMTILKDGFLYHNNNYTGLYISVTAIKENDDGRDLHIIEDLVDYGFQLTPTAQKLIGVNPN